MLSVTSHLLQTDEMFPGSVVLKKSMKTIFYVAFFFLRDGMHFSGVLQAVNVNANGYWDVSLS